MTTLHVSLNAQRSDAFTLDPEMFTLVTDPEHPFFDPRVLDEPDEALVRNIMVYGVIEPVITRKNGDKIEVVAGRGRVKAALEANRRLTAEGKQPIRVPTILKRGQDADMFGVLISENECRREDNPLTKSAKAQRLINMGKSREEVAIAFGVTRQSLDAWLALGDVAQPVLDAVEAGEISATAAAKLAPLARDAQVEAFDAMKAEGGKVTVERAKKAAREGDTAAREPKTKMKSREQVEQELKFWSEQEIEINIEFYNGVRNALQWVLGLGSTWLARKAHKSAETTVTLSDGTEIGWDKAEEAPEQSAETIEVFAYGDVESPLRLPANAHLHSAKGAKMHGWCEDCPLDATAHALISDGSGGYDKFCPRSLVKQGLLDFDRQMASGGIVSGSYVYTQAKALLGLAEASAE